jgi:prepilin-type N-terminal cleavage/methylation domain-containing protein
MKKNKAFSMIEISIVILIIGILVAGVTQSSRLVKQIKLATARSITKSSPVPSIKDLSLWLETTTDESFIEIQADDEYRLTQWNDINPQNPVKFFAIKNGTTAVTYTSEGINSIPSVKFTGDVGVGGYFILSQSNNIAQASKISTFGNRFSFFVVSRPEIEVVGKFRVAFFNAGDPQNDGWGIVKTADNKRGILFNDNMLCSTNTANANSVGEVVSGIYEGVTSSNMTVYVNGNVETTSVVTQSGGSSYTNSSSNDPAYSPLTSNPAMYIGSSGGAGNETWKGLISEIIVYDRVLKNEERKSVEKYLGKKYGIKINE